MARDHLIPAVLLGQFAISDDFAKKPRDRGIYASTKNNRTIKRRRVDNVGYARNFYDHTPLPEGIAAGQTWNAYEDQIPAAAAEVTNAGPLSLINSWIWLKALVPLVAGLYVRGVDFIPAKRVGHFDNKGKLSPTLTYNQNAARLPEHIRLMAPLIGAQWTIVRRAADSKPFLISDLGYGLVAHGRRKDGSPRVNGIMVPLTPDVAVQVERRHPGPQAIAIGVGGNWKTPMRTQTMTAAEVDWFNRSICRNASDFVAGPTPDMSGIDVTEFSKGRYPPPQIPWSRIWGTDSDLTLNGIEWFNVRKELSHPPDDVVCVQLVRSRKYNTSCVEPPGWEPAVSLLPARHMRSLGHSGVERWGCIIKYDPYARIHGRIAGDVLFGKQLPIPESLLNLKWSQIIRDRT
jgi:hypothetical protein